MEKEMKEEMKEVQRDEYCSLAIRSYSNELERGHRRWNILQFTIQLQDHVKLK